MTDNGSVLIVILNYKTYSLTMKLVEQLETLNYPNYNIMIVDNCSPNESASVLKSFAEEKSILFYANNNNAGYAAGNNIGIRRAIADGYQFTWILNNDIQVIDKSILLKMVDVLNENRDVSCVGPKIYDLDGRICSPYIERPSLWTMTLGIIQDKRRRTACNEKSRIVYRVHGCCMLLRNSVMEKIDCMDERTFLFCEEDILAERMSAVGAYSYYCAEAEIIHMESSTIKGESINSRLLIANRTIASMDLYLREYRNYSKLSRWVCKLFRKAVIIFRG